MGSKIVLERDGLAYVDPGILCNKNLLRISDTLVIRVAMVKYVLLYQGLPPCLKRPFANTIGPFFAIIARNDQMTRELQYVTLEEVDYNSRKYVSAYVR